MPTAATLALKKRILEQAPVGYLVLGVPIATATAPGFDGPWLRHYGEYKEKAAAAARAKDLETDGIAMYVRVLSIEAVLIQGDPPEVLENVLFDHEEKLVEETMEELDEYDREDPHAPSRTGVEDALRSLVLKMRAHALREEEGA